jgi:hypothetical protein
MGPPALRATRSRVAGAFFLLLATLASLATGAAATSHYTFDDTGVDYLLVELKMLYLENDVWHAAIITQEGNVVQNSNLEIVNTNTKVTKVRARGSNRVRQPLGEGRLRTCTINYDNSSPRDLFLIAQMSVVSPRRRSSPPDLRRPSSSRARRYRGR